MADDVSERLAAAQGKRSKAKATKAPVDEPKPEHRQRRAPKRPDDWRRAVTATMDGDLWDSLGDLSRREGTSRSALLEVLARTITDKGTSPFGPDVAAEIVRRAQDLSDSNRSRLPE